MEKTKKIKRIEIRVSENTKKLIEYAAELSNISVSSYILSIVLKQAKLDLEQNAEITLNNKERDSLLSSFKMRPKPNKALKELLK